MVPSRVAGPLTQFSPRSGIYFQGDEHSQSLVNSHLSSLFGSSSDSLPRTRPSNKGAAYEDVNGASLNSVGASSLVTDANSAFSGGLHLKRSASINNIESYSHLPTSPLSFTSNDISISSSLIMDGSSVVHHNSQQEQTAPQIQKTQQQGNSSVTAQNSQLFFQMSGRTPGSLIQDPNNFSHVQKKPRIDIKQEDILQQQVLQQLMRSDSMQMQNRNPQMHALLQQQQRLHQQQQILQSMPHLQRAHLQQHQQQQQQHQQQQHQQQLQLRQQMQQQGMQPMNVLKRPNDSGVCARRLMQYLYHQRQRPPDNAIAYWRKFVAEYYSPRAKKRWCLSLYENVGQHALGVFPQAAMDAWQCDICNSKSGRGFEATFEVLPRLNEIKFGSGVIDELLFLDLPKEYRTSTGLMVLEYAKAVQESVHEQLRVVREGHLRIVFAQDLKILSWEFCARRHEELLSRCLIAPQVSQLLQVAQKCNSAVTKAGAEGVSSQDLQTSSNMVQPAWRQLAKTVELQSLNDLGFSKRYVRCLQISEVVNSMKDLIDFCRDKKSGPIDGLKNYPRRASTAKLQIQEIEHPSNVQRLHTDGSVLNNLMSVHQNTVGNSNNHIISRGALSGTPQASIALTSYQNMLMRQNSMNPTHSSSPNPNLNNSHQQETPSLSNSTQSPSSTKHLGYNGSGYSSPQLPPHQSMQQQQQRLQLQQQRGATNNPSGAHPQLFQEMSNNNGGSRVAGTVHQQHSVSMVGGLGNNSPQPSTSNVSSGTMSRNNSFKEAVASNGDSLGPAVVGTNRLNSRTQDITLPPDDIISDIVQEFTDNGFFNGDFDDAIMSFNWK